MHNSVLSRHLVVLKDEIHATFCVLLCICFCSAMHISSAFNNVNLILFMLLYSMNTYEHIYCCFCIRILLKCHMRIAEIELHSKMP